MDEIERLKAERKKFRYGTKGYVRLSASIYFRRHREKVLAYQAARRLKLKEQASKPTS